MSKLELLKIMIIKSFPEGLVQVMDNINLEKIEEIRIRVDKPVILKCGVNEIVLKYKVNTDEILNILQN